MHNSPLGSKEKVESSIPNWVVYALLSIVSLLIATSVHGALVVLTASGIVTLFVMSYMSKPVAEIRPTREKNIFDRNEINKSTWNKNTETNPQRKRYLKTLDKEDRRVA